MLRTYPAKVLLFGEYTILNGTHALAIPFEKFGGTWSYEIKENQGLSQKHLFKFIDTHDCKNLDIDQFRRELEKGMWFDSSIPQGYGLGSSGALVAAIYDRFGTTESDHPDIQKTLGHLENFFHGSSSGIDPLVSYLNKSLHIKNPSNIEIVNFDFANLDLFLLNTHRPRQTGPLVGIYKEKLKDANFKLGCSNILGQDVNSAIEYALTGNKEKLFHHFWHISKFQWEYFQEMIPDMAKDIWKKGLDQGEYALKLCGAGGGGLILGMSKVESPLRDYDIIWP